jgi:transketolase
VTLREGSYEAALASLAAEHDALVVLTAENRAPIRNLPLALGPRFIDVGICEQTMIGVAAGLALRGRIPVCHALAAFLVMRAFEFIRSDVGIAELPVKLVGYVPGFLSDGNGPTHQAIEDVSIMRGIPGMGVYCPSDEAELVDALPAILTDPSPCYIRFNASPPHLAHSPFVRGQAELLSEGKDVAILTYGFLLGEALKARAVLESRGLGVRLVNLRSLKPVDEGAILEAARRCPLVVILEDHFVTGGLHSIVAEVLLKHRCPVRALPLALEDRWFTPALLEDVLVHEGFTGAQIAERIFGALREDAVHA